MASQTLISPDQARWPRDGHNHLVLGGPQSGKTTTAVHAFVDFVRSNGPQRAVFLAPTRIQADRLRTVITNKFGGTTEGMLVRTPASLAFGILRDGAVQQGQPAPTLITGPEQDHILTELLAGHIEDGGGPQWPDSFSPELLGMRAFRDELRDLLMRAAEAGLDGESLQDWGRRYNRQEWIAAGELLIEYGQVTLLGQTTPDRGPRYDSATIIDQAITFLRNNPHEGLFDVVVHDDYQNATLATSRLLTLLAERGAQILLTSNPDTGVQGFRGGLPALSRTATLPRGSQDGALGATAHVLNQVWMEPGIWQELNRLAKDLPPLVGSGRHQASPRSGPSPYPNPVEKVQLSSPHAESAFIARKLRQEHLFNRTPWSDMAVIVRSHNQAMGLRRVLTGAHVPVVIDGVEVPLRDEPVVQALLTILEVATQPEGPDEDQLVRVLLSKFGGIDSITLRRIRRNLRHYDPSSTSTTLLIKAMSDATVLRHSGNHPGVVRVANMFAAGRRAVEQNRGVDVILWEIWQASGLAKPWQQQALERGPGADTANADLDAVVTLFTVVERFVERQAGAAPEAFIRYVRDQDFAADTLAQRAGSKDAVAIHTATSAAGQHWPVVVVGGVYEDVWPDLRIRDSLLGAAQLTEVATSRHVDQQRLAHARQGVYEDEKRMFLSACSRAVNKLIVTAVADQGHQPSIFFDSLSTLVTHINEISAPLDLRGLVGTLRAVVHNHQTSPEVTDAARKLLADLVHQGVEEADPSTWLPPWSGTGPIVGEGKKVTLHPSSIEQLLTCPLQWFLTQYGGRPAQSPAQNLGTLIHKIAAAHPQADQETLIEALQEGWPELGLADNHIGRKQWQRAVEMLGRLAQYYFSHPAPAHVEVAFEVDVGPAILKGSVDRLELREEGPHVVDFKTGGSRVAAKELPRHPQLGAYQLALRHGAFSQLNDADLGGSTGASLVFLGVENKHVLVQQQTPLDQDENPDWAQQMVAEAAQIVVEGNYPAKPSSACRTCVVRFSCPAVEEGKRLA